MIITGRTGCGKTNGKFNSIVIFCPTIEENRTYKRTFIEKDDGVHIFPPTYVENDLNGCLDDCSDPVPNRCLCKPESLQDKEL
jgi:hypothetical protein